MKQNEFKGVRDYIDRLFEGRSPSEAEINDAKKVYWRKYNTALKRSIRHNYPSLRLRFTKDEMQRLKEKLQQKELLSLQVKRIVLLYLENEGYAVQNSAVLEQQLFLVSDYLEELLEEDSCVPMAKIERLQGYIVAIQEVLEQSG